MNEFEIIEEKIAMLGKIGRNLNLIKEGVLAYSFRLKEGTENDGEAKKIKKNLDQLVLEAKKNYELIILELSKITPNTHHSDLIHECITLLVKAKNQLPETYEITIRILNKLQDLDARKNIGIIHQFNEVIINSFEKYLIPHNQAVMLLGTYRNRQAA